MNNDFTNINAVCMAAQPCDEDGCPVEHDLCPIRVGDTATFDFLFLQSNGTPINVDGMLMEFTAQFEGDRLAVPELIKRVVFQSGTNPGGTVDDPNLPVPLALSDHKSMVDEVIAPTILESWPKPTEAQCATSGKTYKDGVAYMTLNPIDTRQLTPDERYFYRFRLIVPHQDSINRPTAADDEFTVAAGYFEAVP